MCGLGFRFGLDRAGDGQLAADLLDGRLGGFRGAVDGDLDLRGQLALAEQADAVLLATDDAGLEQRFGVDGLLRVELAGGDRLLETPEVHFDQLLGERVVEAALGHAHVQRHLAAFEAADGDARARLLALHTATGGLALARTRAAADAHAVLGGALLGREFVQFRHDASPWRSGAGAKPRLGCCSVPADAEGLRTLKSSPIARAGPDPAFARMSGYRVFSRPLPPCGRPWRSSHGRRGCPRARGYDPRG